MKKTLLSIVACLSLSAASFAQMDLSVTDITNPVPGSAITVGSSIPFTFNVNVVTGSIANGDTLVFSLVIPGVAQPTLLTAPIAQDVPTGMTFQMSTPDISTTGMNSGPVDICVKYLGLYQGQAALPTTDANTANDELCKEYNPGPVVGINEATFADSKVYFANNELVYVLNSVENTTISVYNTSGQLVRNETVNNNNGSFNMSDLNSGLYIVNIKSGNNVMTKKIVKM